MGPRTRRSRAAPAPQPPPASDPPPLTDEPAASLASAGDAAWKHSYYQLNQFHRERGHCEVPLHEPAWRKLAAWIAQQRDLKERGKLPGARQAALEALGFTWESEREPSGWAVQNDARWEQRYAELLAFHREHGHTRVNRLPPGNPVLWHWRHVQRDCWRQSILKPERIALLDAIGFEWEEAGRGGASQKEHWENRWAQMFEQLVQFKKRFGHCRVGPEWRENPALGKWVGGQRAARKRDELRPDRLARLDELGFDWDLLGGSDTFNARWEQRFGELLAFKSLTGHTNVSKTAPGNQVLWNWRHVQSEFRRKGKLSPGRIARLDAIGFEWAKPGGRARPRSPLWDDLWEQRFDDLVRFKKRFGHCRVSMNYRANPSLAAWVNAQKVAHLKGTVRPDREARLEALGFEWSIKGRGLLAEKWEQRFTELLAFKDLTGHTRVPQQPPGDKVLWHWRLVQREFRRKGKLSAERIARLDAIGFEWQEPERFARSADPQWEEQWEGMFQQLAAFKERFGHCAVSASWQENRLLGQWVMRHRAADRRDELRPDRRARLDALGFVWDNKERGHFAKLWESRYAVLRAFVETHGHARLPMPPNGDKLIWSWGHTQRDLYRKGRLPPDRIARLEALGFQWTNEGPSPLRARIVDAGWEEKFQLLVQFKERHGHLHIPKDTPVLSNWTNRQRRHIRNGTITPEHQARLLGLGFSPVPPPGNSFGQVAWSGRVWAANFELLRQFHERFGHLKVPKCWPENPKLGNWLGRQRQDAREGKITPEHAAQLTALGFSSPPPRKARAAAARSTRRDEEKWTARFEQLQRFHERFGHLRVPRGWPEDPSLAHWVHNQRQFLRKGKLTVPRSAHLQALGFE